MQPGFISTELLGRFVRHKLKSEGGVRIDSVAAARSGCLRRPYPHGGEKTIIYCLSDLKAPDRPESR